MNSDIFSAPKIHFHWVRETPSRGLEMPVSQTLTSLETLPPCVQKAVLATGLAEVEVHLPPYLAVTDETCEQWLDSLRFRQDAVGRVNAVSSNDPDPLTSMAFHQAVVLALRAIGGGTTPLTLVAETPASPVLPRQLPKRHVCSPRGALAGAPGERSKHYAYIYRHVSIALQNALREALPGANLPTVDALADIPQAHSLLAWGSAAPVVGRHVDQLAVDVLDRQLIKRACVGMDERFYYALAAVHEVLTRLDAPRAVRDNYDPENAVTALQHCRRYPKVLHLLFANEFRVIQAFVLFCASIEKWRAKARGNPAVVYREVRESWKDVESRLRRFYRRQPQCGFGSLLLVEAVRILEAID
ncbi:MAG: hypothetical protein HYX27_20315 [Acidobacteria bacterium]|nr:hypothetical protein [Acidobacteriota bacterium]